MWHCEVRDGLLVMKMSSISFCLVVVVIICSVWVVRSLSNAPVTPNAQWNRHDRRSSAVVPSLIAVLIAVAPPKTVKPADLRGRRASAVLPPSH